MSEVTPTIETWTTFAIGLRQAALRFLASSDIDGDRRW